MGIGGWNDRPIDSIAIDDILGLGVLWGRPFAEDVDADVGEVEGDAGGEGGVDRDGEAGKVDQGSDGSSDEGSVAGILFQRLNQAADAVIVATDFLLEAFLEGTIGKENSW